MASKSAVDRLLNPSNYGRGISTPPARIPERLRLPDGRTFVVRDLLERVGTAISIQRVINRSKVKYSPEEKTWIASMSAEDIALKYNISKIDARELKKYCKTWIRKAADNENKT